MFERVMRKPLCHFKLSHQNISKSAKVSQGHGHCVKSVHIRSFSGPYFPAFRLNTERYWNARKYGPEKPRIGTLFTQWVAWKNWEQNCSTEKGRTRFFISSSIFHLNLRLLGKDINFRLKVAKKLLTKYKVSLSF